MKAVILAAGRGSRMGALTAKQPKCAVNIAGHSLFAYQRQALKAGGAEEIAVVRGYCGDWFPSHGLTLFDNPRWEETNMVMSLVCASEWLRREPCLVSYSDIFYDAATVSSLAAAPGELAISYDPDWLSLWSARFSDPLADAETFRLDDENNLIEIGQRATSVDEIKGQYMGLLRFVPVVWSIIEEQLERLDPAQRDRLDMTSLLRLLIGNGVRIVATPRHGSWGEVDSAEDAQYYEGLVRNGCLRMPTILG